MKAVLFLLWYLVVDLVYVLGSDIYKSVNWAPQNALFQADGKSCRRGPRYLKVQLNSKINFVCPNTATVLQKRSTAVQASAMYENLWLLENKTAFENCDRTMDPKARRLLTCSSPVKLTYTAVIFAQFTAEDDGLTFVGGRTYYFIATSDGTESSLNDTFGGHCDDPSMKVNMKIAVYICKKTQDDNCNETNVGKVTCDAPEPPTTASTASTAPTTAETTTQGTTTNSNWNTSTKPQESSTSHGSSEPSRTNQPKPTPQSRGKSHGRIAQQESSDLSSAHKDRDMWMITAIIAMAMCVFLVVIGIMLYLNCFGIKKGRIVSPKMRKPSKAERQKSVVGMTNRAFSKDTMTRDSNVASSPYGPNPYYGNVTVETTTFNHAYELEAEDCPEKDINITLENEGVYDVVKGDDKEDGNASSNENGKEHTGQTGHLEGLTLQSIQSNTL